MSALITVHVAKTSGAVAGFYLSSNNVGSFSLAGGLVKLASPTEATHSAPSSAGTAAEATFQLRWNAPPTKGGVVFDVEAVSANGNNDPGGDAPAYGRLAMTSGCPGIMVFVDQDGDGFGRDSDQVRVCELGPGYSAKGGDCDDSNPEAYPGHPELCNYFDDNCDGTVDNGAFQDGYEPNNTCASYSTLPQVGSDQTLTQSTPTLYPSGDVDSAVFSTSSK